MHLVLSRTVLARQNVRRNGSKPRASFQTAPTASYLLHGKLPGTGEREVFHFPGEYTFNLAEYMVVLDKPIGLSVAPDPSTGQIVVQKVVDGSTAAVCKLIQVGDILKKCGSTAEGEEMIVCSDLSTTKWALANKARQGKVKLVLERGKACAAPRSWCCSGKPGMASSTRETLQAPVQLDDPPAPPRDGSDSSRQCMLVGFHRHTERYAQMQRNRTSSADARAARTRELRQQLLTARDNPSIQINPSKRGDGSSGLTPLETLTQPFVNAAWLVSGRRSGSNKKVVAALPWLLIATSRLSTKELSVLASQHAWSCVMELSLQWHGSVLGLRGAASSNDTSPQAPLRSLIAIAAALNRLKYRRASYLSNQPWRSVLCDVLVHCDENMEGEVGKVLGCWLHWYGGLELSESVRAARDIMGCRLDKSTVEGATELLVELGKERASQVLLTWPYGGLAADVCGDLVGGWDVRVPLKRWTSETTATGKTMAGQFFLELKGLKPGCYHYKYIVDGTWTVDHYAPKALDASGNWNNCLYVSALPPVVTKEDRLYLARLEAAHQSLQTKLGLPLRHRSV